MPTTDGNQPRPMPKLAQTDSDGFVHVSTNKKFKSKKNKNTNHQNPTLRPAGRSPKSKTNPEFNPPPRFRQSKSNSPEVEETTPTKSSLANTFTGSDDKNGTSSSPKSKSAALEPDSGFKSPVSHPQNQAQIGAPRHASGNRISSLDTTETSSFTSGVDRYLEAESAAKKALFQPDSTIPDLSTDQTLAHSDQASLLTLDTPTRFEDTTSNKQVEPGEKTEDTAEIQLGPAANDLNQNLNQNSNSNSKTKTEADTKTTERPNFTLKNLDEIKVFIP